MSLTLVCCGQAAGWIKMPFGAEVGLSPGDIVLDGGSASPTERGTAAPTFRSMSTVAKKSTISATAELLFFCHLKPRENFRSITYTPWAIKRSQVIFACNFVNNQRFLMQFSMLDLKMNHTLCYELHPLHLINVATLLKTLKM